MINIYLAFYLMFGSYLAGVNMTAGLVRIPIMIVGWPGALILIYVLEKRKKKKHES